MIRVADRGQRKINRARWLSSGSLSRRTPFFVCCSSVVGFNDGTLGGRKRQVGVGAGQEWGCWAAPVFGAAVSGEQIKRDRLAVSRVYLGAAPLHRMDSVITGTP